MIEQLGALVSVESPSEDLAACATSAAAVRALAGELVGDAGEVVEVEGRSHLRWSFGEPGRALLVGHHDTVWPMGTLARWPFSVDAARRQGDRAGRLRHEGRHRAAVPRPGRAGRPRRPRGRADMRRGGRVADAAERSSRRRPGGRAAALVLEPSAAGGALKSGRKGTGMYTLVVEGKAAHAGLEPEKGANALIELAHLVLALDASAGPSSGTTVTPTVASAGTATNVVPARPRVEVDVRVAVPEEARRVDDAIRRPRHHRARAAASRCAADPTARRCPSHQRCRPLAAAPGGRRRARARPPRRRRRRRRLGRQLHRCGRLPNARRARRRWRRRPRRGRARGAGGDGRAHRARGRARCRPASRRLSARRPPPATGPPEGGRPRPHRPRHRAGRLHRPRRVASPDPVDVVRHLASSRGTSTWLDALTAPFAVTGDARP